MSVPAALARLGTALTSAETASLFAEDRAPFGTLRRAAVLALFWSDAAGAATEAGPAAGLRLVAIEKSGQLRRHAGQIAFPGGRIEEAESPREAALREAAEEVGIVADHVVTLGELPPASVMASGFDVHSVVGWWTRPVPLSAVDLGEVAAVHQLVVPRLIDPANRATWVHPSGHTGPVFLLDDLFVWGLTGYLISTLLDLAGWSEPWDAARRLEIPHRFFRGRHT